MASAVETVITCLTDPDAIDKVYGGPSGVLAGDLTLPDRKMLELARTHDTRRKTREER